MKDSNPQINQRPGVYSLDIKSFPFHAKALRFEPILVHACFPEISPLHELCTSCLTIKDPLPTAQCVSQAKL